MAGSREHYIPLRRSDLVHLLANELDRASAEPFRRFADILSATFHFEYKRLADQLKDTYAPFDPEATTFAGQQYTAEDRAMVLDELFHRVDELLRKANFVPIEQADLDRAATIRSEWGINMEIDFNAFEKYRLYYRGNTVGQRGRRHWLRFWKEDVVDVPIYQRLALIIKLKRCDRFPKTIDTDDVFLKYFKEIPQADIEMLLPGARMIMPGTHRLKLGGSVFSGLAVIGFNVGKQLWDAATLGVTYFYGLTFAIFGYSWRQYAGYQSARHKCSLRLTESLYFQTLANNVGVIACLLDEAEEQDTREAILAYYFLWRHGAMTARELDAAIERDIEAKTGRPVDFEVDDALAKLERMGLVTDQSGRYVAALMEDALTILDRAWDGQFTYHTETAFKRAV